MITRFADKNTHPPIAWVGYVRTGPGWPGPAEVAAHQAKIEAEAKRLEELPGADSRTSTDSMPVELTFERLR